MIELNWDSSIYWFPTNSPTHVRNLWVNGALLIFPGSKPLFSLSLLRLLKYHHTYTYIVQILPNKQSNWRLGNWSAPVLFDCANTFLLGTAKISFNRLFDNIMEVWQVCLKGKMYKIKPVAANSKMSKMDLVISWIGSSI